MEKVSKTGTASKSHPRPRKATGSYEYARQALAEDHVSPLHLSVFEEKASGNAARTPVVLELLVFNKEDEAVHVFDEERLNENIKARRKEVEAMYPSAKAPVFLAELLYDHVVVATLSPIAPGLAPIQRFGVMVAPLEPDEHVNEKNWRPIPDHLLSYYGVADSRAGELILANIQHPSAGGPYTHTRSDGSTFEAPIAWDPRYLVERYVKAKTPAPAPAPAPAAAPVSVAPAEDAPATPDIDVEGVDAFALMSKDAETSQVFQASALDEVSPLLQPRVWGLPADFDDESILGPLSPAAAGETPTLPRILALHMLLVQNAAAELAAERFHKRDDVALSTQTIDTVIEQHRADTEAGRAADVRIGGVTVEARALAEAMLKEMCSADLYRPHHLIRLFLAMDKSGQIREGTFPEAVGRLCAFTNRVITDPNVYKLLVHVPRALPGVIEDPQGGWVITFCRKSFRDGVDMVSKAREAAEQARKKAEEEAKRAAEEEARAKLEAKARARADARAGARKRAREEEAEELEVLEEGEIKLSPKKQKKRHPRPPPPDAVDADVDAMDIDDPAPPPAAIFKPPRLWAVPSNYVVVVSPTLRALREAAKAEGPTELDELVCNLLACDMSGDEDARAAASQPAFDAIDRATKTPDASSMPFFLIAQFVRPRKPGDNVAYLPLSYDSPPPSADAFRALAFLLGVVYGPGVTDAMRQVHAVKEQGPFGPLQRAVARVIFCGLAV